MRSVSTALIRSDYTVARLCLLLRNYALVTREHELEVGPIMAIGIVPSEIVK